MTASVKDIGHRQVYDIVKDIGHRQVYDILQSRKPRATGGDLWGFRVSRRYDVRATAAEMRVGGGEHGGRDRCPGWILPRTGA